MCIRDSYKTNNTTKTVAINPGAFKVGANQLAQLQQQESNAAVEEERAALTA